MSVYSLSVDLLFRLSVGRSLVVSDILHKDRAPQGYTSDKSPIFEKKSFLGEKRENPQFEVIVGLFIHISEFSDLS